MEPDQPEPSSLRRSTISAGDESEQEEDESDGENDLDNDSEEGQNEVTEDDWILTFIVSRSFSL